MSLPVGIVNRPTVTAPHPVIYGGIFRVIGLVALIALPLLAHVAVSHRGIDARQAASQLQTRIDQARRARRELLAEREALLASPRLEREARRLGLVPAPLEAQPVTLEITADEASR